MSWTFESSTGKLYDRFSRYISTGYSGAPGYIDNPADENLKDKGPIPAGRYTIGEPFQDSETGPYSMRLTPDPANNEFGRGGFLLHGDSISHPGCASKGCPVFGYVARVQVWESGDHILDVVPVYTPEPVKESDASQS